MGIQIYPTVPVAQPEAEPWPVDEHMIRVDEMFARQLDIEFSAGVRAVLHHPETGISAQGGEAALSAIAGALPVLNELKQRTLSQAMGPRQRSILEPLIETRLNWVAGTLGQLAQRATVEVDDQSVADRIAGLGQDAAAAWRDPAYLQKLGRTAVEELRYQGERRGWDPAETDARVRGGLSDFYAGAVEAAIGTAINGDDLDGASGLYEHARPIIDPERQAALDRRFVRAREVAFYRDIDRDLEGIPIEPAGPPAPEVFESRAAELTPEDATDEMRTRIAQVAAHAHRHAERQWSRRQAEAGVAAFDWVAKNPGRSFLAIPPEVRDWLAPDQWHGLEAFYIDGRLRTDRDLYERLDWQLIYEPHAFAGADLDRHRLSLDDEDHARFVAGQKAIVEGRVDPGHVRHDWLRRGIDRALTVLGIDTNGPEAADARADARDQLDSFETIEGRAPVGADLDDIARRVVETLAPEVTGTRETATPSPDPGSNAGTIEDIGPVPDEDDSVEEQPEPPDSPFDEEATLSPFPADGEEHDEPVASAAPDNADDVSIVPDVEPPGMATPDLGSVEDGTPPRFADDPNIIRVAGGANSPRRGGGGRPTTPTEQIRAANFQSTLNAIRELEPNNRELSGITTRDWIPSDRDIARVREELLRAKARAAGETSAVPVGKYAGESIPAGSPGRRFTSEERREVDRIGSERGCHSCGATSPGTSLQHWVPDHQPPTALTRQGQAQRLYPQCLSCSRQQGGEVNNLKREGNRE